MDANVLINNKGCFEKGPDQVQKSTVANYFSAKTLNYVPVTSTSKDLDLRLEKLLFAPTLLTNYNKYVQ